jgi:hypothetical protein
LGWRRFEVVCPSTTYPAQRVIEVKSLQQRSIIKAAGSRLTSTIAGVVIPEQIVSVFYAVMDFAPNVVAGLGEVSKPCGVSSDLGASVSTDVSTDVSTGFSAANGTRFGPDSCPSFSANGACGGPRIRSCSCCACSCSCCARCCADCVCYSRYYWN